MRLILRRRHRAGVLHRVIYVLDVRAHLSHAEHGVLVEHGLGGMHLYQRLEVADPGRGLLGSFFRFFFRARNPAVKTGDLLNGTRITSHSLREILSIEDQIRAAARTLGLLVAAAAGFDGEEVVEL